MTIRKIAVVVFALMAATIALQAAYDLSYGGDPYRQGDWLINQDAVLIRRGPIGSFLIWISDLGGVPLLWLSVALPGLLTLALVAILVRLLPATATENPLFLLYLSSGFCLLAWGGDANGALRKELFGLLALAFLVWRAGSGRIGWLSVALVVALITAGAFGHESNILLVPVLLASVFLARRAGQLPARRAAIFALSLAIVAVAAAGYALVFRRVADAGLVCAPLLARDVAAHVCTGAIRWLAWGAENIAASFGPRLTGDALTGFAAATAIALAPVAYFLWLCRERPLALRLLLLCLICILPLYGVGVDWGRWLALQVTCFTLLATQAVHAVRLNFRADPPATVLLILLALALVFPPAHFAGIHPGGAFEHLYALAFTYPWGALP